MRSAASRRQPFQFAAPSPGHPCESQRLHSQFPDTLGICLGGFMSSLRLYALGAALGLALSIGGPPTKGYAYTAEEEQACTPDAMRLCGAYIPDVDRITACMIQNRSQLSPECGRFFRQEPAPGEAAAARPARKPIEHQAGGCEKAESQEETEADHDLIADLPAHAPDSFCSRAARGAPRDLQRSLRLRALCDSKASLFAFLQFGSAPPRFVFRESLR